MQDALAYYKIKDPVSFLPGLYIVHNALCCMLTYSASHFRHKDSGAIGIITDRVYGRITHRRVGGQLGWGDSYVKHCFHDFLCIYAVFSAPALFLLLLVIII